MSDENLTEDEVKNMSPEEMAEMQKKNCVFCRIAKNEVPSHKVYEDDKILAILDIYPSAKGHTLLLPKEHVPIMPLMPAGIFKHMFRKIKYISKGIKQGAPSEKTTIFIANGGIAGQQSPHFLLHIIPRNRDDKLTNFTIPAKNISQKDLIKPIRANIERMIAGHLQKEGKIPAKPPTKDELAKILETNPQLKQLIMLDPERVKREMEKNPQLKIIFQGIDIDKLSSKLREIESAKNPPQKKEEAKEEKRDEETEEQTEEESDKDEEKPKAPPNIADAEEEFSDDEDDKPKGGGSLLDRISDMFTK